ncbi:MAG: D-glycero-beta-D-manno-heptose-7-phosphate kinase [Thermodesulfovibrionales bacterium]|nr:D-glycero-beta-D-manno-heptose-7-phosphate kinase [Thermodesulfovibrionales bacterium]
MKNIERLIERFSKSSILVIGDLILDRYIWGKVSRVSPEAPVPVVEVTKEDFLLGGAANVAANIVSLGGRVYIAGVTGNDRAREVLLKLMEEKGIDTSGVVADKRPTTVKTRVIAHHQQVVRFDKEDHSRINSELLKRLLNFVEDKIKNSRIDAVIISDYKKGVVSRELIKGILRLSKPSGIFVSVDPKVGHFAFYRGVSIITPNLKEASEGSGIEIKDETTLLRAGKKLLRTLSLEAVLITRGEEGMSLFMKEKEKSDSIKHHYIPTRAKKVFDVTGAGDTVIATFTLARASGASMIEACEIANYAAGIVVGEIGTATVTPEQLKEAMKC